MNNVKSLKVRLEEIRSSFNFSPKLEDSYQATTYPHSIFMMRLAITLGALTYLSFFLWILSCFQNFIFRFGRCEYL